MKKFQHFVITRFNLKKEDWNHDKNNKKVLDGNWLDNRYSMFDNYCFPSIKNQNQKDFIWLVYFDVNTPHKYKVKNNYYSKTLGNFVPLYKSSFEHFKRDLNEDIKKLLNYDTEYLISSRIDNDDAFHFSTIELIQKKFNMQESAIIDLNKGYCLQLYPRFKLSIVSINFGPFISLVEKIHKNEFITVMDKEHSDWPKMKIAIEKVNEISWIQIIHENNLVNKFYGKEVYSMFSLEGFNLKGIILFRVKYEYVKKIFFKVLSKLTNLLNFKK